jgi:hypothetical protein
MFGLGSSGLGDGVEGTDFWCTSPGGGNYVCLPKKGRTEVDDSYKDLQTTVREITKQMAASGRLAVPGDLTVMSIDGDIGKITTVGVQFVGAAFMAVAAPPEPVAYALATGISAKESVKRIATHAEAINDWFLQIARDFPEAIAPEPEVVEKIVERVKVVEQKFSRRFRPIGAVVLAAGFLGMLGIAAAAIHQSRKAAEGAAIRRGDF